MKIETVHQECHVIYAIRDPTEKDVDAALWISKEYTPYRVFIGANGVWTFIGKLYPVEEK